MDFSITDKRKVFSLTSIALILSLTVFSVFRLPSKTKREIEEQTGAHADFSSRLSGSTTGDIEKSADTVDIQSRPPQVAFESMKKSKAVRSLLSDPKNNLKEYEHVEAQGVSTTKFQHYYEGVEVLGSVAFFHKGPAGEQVRAKLFPVDINTKPDLTRESAEEMALRTVGGGARLRGESQLKIVPSEYTGKTRLVYIVMVTAEDTRPHEVWVDAHSKEIVADISKSGFRAETKTRKDGT